MLLVNINSKECWSKLTSNILDGLSPENYSKAMVSMFIYLLCVYLKATYCNSFNDFYYL